MAGLNLKVGINVLQATRELRSLSKSIANIGVATKKANKDAAGLAGAFGGIGAAVGSFSGLLVQATGALAVFGTGAAAKSALAFTADFEKNLADINTILGDGGVSIQQYEKQLLDLSTQSSKTLDDLSRGLYQTISAGIPAVEGASGAFAVLEASQKAAVAGLASTESAVDATVSVLNAYGTESFFASEVTDKLLKTVELGRVRFDELSRGIGRVAPIAASAGVALDDVLAVFIQLTRQGIKPAEAITGLRNILKTLVRPTAKSTKTVALLNAELAKTGSAQIELGSQVLRQDGLIGVLKSLTDATGGSTEALAEIFPNVRALIPAIVSVGDGFEQTAKFQQLLADSTGETERKFKIIDATFNETFDKLISNIGRVAVAGFSDILDNINVRLKELNEFLSDEGNIKAIADGINTAASAAASFGSVAVSSFSAVSFVLKEIVGLLGNLFSILTFGTDRVDVFSVAVLAAAAALVKFKTSFSALFLLFAGIGGVGALITGIANSLVGALTAVGAAGAAVLVTFVSIKSVISDLAGSGVESLGELFSEAGAFFGKGEFILSFLGFLSAALASVLDLITRAVGLILTVPTLLATMATSILNVFLPLDGAVDFLNKKLGSFISLFTDGMFGVANAQREATKETRRSKAELKRLEKQAQDTAKALGFSGAKERESFSSDVASGKRVDLGELIGGQQASEQLNAINESASKFAETLDKDTRKAVEDLGPLIEEFFTKFDEGAKKSQLNAKELFARLRAEISKSGSKLSEVDQIGLAFTSSFEAFGGELISVNDEIAAIEAEMSGLIADREVSASRSLGLESEMVTQNDAVLTLKYEQLEQERKILLLKQSGLESELQTLNAINAANAAKRDEIELALKKAKQKKAENKRQKALNDLLKIESNLLKGIAEAQLEITSTRQRLLDIDIRRLEASRALSKESQDESFEALKKLNVLRDTAKVEALRAKVIKDSQSAIRSIEGTPEDPNDFFDGQLVKEREKATLNLFKIAREQKNKELDLKLSIEETEKKLNEIQKVTGNKSTLRARRLMITLKELKSSLSELSVSEKLRNASDEVDAAVAKLDKAAKDIAKVPGKFTDQATRQSLALFESNTANLIEGVKRRNKAFLDSFESDLDRKDFKAKLEFVSADSGVSIDEALSALRRDIREKLSNIGISQEDISRPLFDAIRSLKAVGKPQELAEFVRVAVSDFNIAISSGTAEEISKAKQLIETRVKALKESLKDTPEAAEFLRSLDDNVKKAVGPTAQMAVNLADAAAAAVSLKNALGELANESELVPGKIFDSAFQALGDLSFNFGEKIAGAIGSSVSKLPAVFQAGRDLIDAKLRDKFFVNLNNESGFIRGVAGGIVGAANLFVRVTGEGVLAVANLFVKTIGDILTPIGTAIAAPVERLLGSLGAAVGVLADTPEEEDRRDRKEALELQRATLAQLQRSGASNDQIAQEQAALAALLRSQQGDEPQTAAERLEEEINRSVEAALNIAEQLGPLVTQFFQTVTEKLPEVFPLLVKGLVEALDAFGEYFPQFFEILVQEVVDALPDIIAAIIRLIPRLIEALARGLFALIRGLPGILLGVFRGIGEAITIGILKSLSSGIARIFEDLTTGEGGKVTAGLTGGAAIGAGLGAIFGGVPGAKVGAIAGGALGSLLGAIFHDGGNVTSGMKNKSLASQYRAAGVQGFLDGGMVGDTLRRNFRASMSDDVPALLQTGEAVLNRAAVSNIGGPSAIDAINSGAGVAPNLNVNVGINPNANGLGQAAAALLPFLIGSISVAGPGSKPSSQNLMGFRGIGGAPLIRQS